MNIGFIGTGLMGLPMAHRLLDAHHALSVYNRTAAKVEPLRASGAKIAASPDAVIAASEFVVLMLTDASAIRSVLLTQQARRHLSGRTVIQMSTIAPDESRAIRDEVAAANGEYIEAPVLGSIPEARSGNLIVMVGATPLQFERSLPVLSVFGSEPVLLGSVGAAATTKLALNQLIGTMTSAFSASLGLVLRQNVETAAFMNILRKSALYAPTFDKKLQRMLDQDYSNPNFPTKHLKKDIDLFIATAQANQLRVEPVEGVGEILKAALQQGLAEEDYASLFSIICP
ncbi:NAD(P)-binding domain-containing protein [Myxacorys almedinensis]|uniref:NAD-binding protein n=1 Tax=Myxacorys almedinensis A TaxID=2690445 RepID=A0A8J7Z1P2_9CYAN|nr:NAD-binding protein [Myxacorys almedinensis A]